MKKIIFVVVGLIILGGILVYIFPGILIKTTFLMQNPQSKYPLMYATPTARNVSAQAVGAPFTFQTLKLSLPFGQLSKETKSADGNLVALDFTNGQNVALIKELDIYGMMFQNIADDKQKLFSAYVANKYGIASNYNYYQAVAGVTPDQLKMFGNRADVVTQSTLLLIKPILFLNQNSSTFYSFETPTIKGFQTGTAGQDNVTAIVFDPQDNVYTIGFNKIVTQNEIDEVIASIK